MGLAVAYQLAKDGFQPVVFEADDRLGGMAAHFDFAGLSIERYYHFHCTSDTGFIQLLDELTLSDKLNWRVTKMGYWFGRQLQAWGNPIALLKFQGLSWTAKFRYGLHAFMCAKRKKENWQDLDGVNAKDWVKKWVGAEAYAAMWQRLFDYKFFHYSDNLSAAWIWSRVRRIGQSRYNLFKEKLGYLDGGSATLLDALGAAITKQGGEIHLQTPVSKVCIEAGRVTGVEANGEFHAFDKVISTVPLPYVADMIPDLPAPILAQYRTQQNIAVVCVIVKLTKPVSDNFWVNTNDERMDIPGIIEYSNLRPLAEPVVYVPYYMPAEHPDYQLSNEEFIAKSKRYLQLINPELSEADFLAAHASRYRYAQPICPPNFLESLPPYNLPVTGLWAADTSYYYPEDRGISESIDFGRQLAREAQAAS